MASRSGEQEHEASRRMKTQLLVELDGLTKANDHVFLLAASNVPWWVRGQPYASAIAFREK